MFIQKKTNYMETVRLWLKAEIFTPLTRAYATGDKAEIEQTQLVVEKAIKEKLLESYKNGINTKSKM